MRYSNVRVALAGTALWVAVPALANQKVHNDKFWDHQYIASLAAPDWHFDRFEGCYPTAAFWNGQKTPPGSEYSPSEGQATQYRGCAPEEKGDRAHDFPTYYRVRLCDYGGDHQEFHVMYSAFFPYSTNAPFGHNYDWEWAVVKWERTPGDRNYWQRKSIVLAAHGNKQEWKWADYPRTNKPGDESNWQKNLENPVIKFGLDGHGLQAKYDTLGKWYRARDWLSDGHGFPVTDWGKADSPPNTFEEGGSRDLCWKM